MRDGGDSAKAGWSMEAAAHPQLHPHHLSVSQVVGVPRHTHVCAHTGLATGPHHVSATASAPG